MNIKTTLITLSLFVIASPVFAADAGTIAGISKDATAAEFVMYFFNLGIAIGAFIAVVIIIMAGIEWMTSDGNPSKIESAKDKIKNTLLGVVVLVGCYLILDAINPSLKNIKINKLYCSQGIAVMAKSSVNGVEKTAQTCVTKTTSTLKDIGEIVSTLDWNFLKDTLLSVYTYSGENFTGTMTEFSCENGGCSGNFGDISGAQSIYFLWKTPGLYLFNQTNYKPGSIFPILASSSIDNLSSVGFDNLASSIKIINPNPGKDNSYYQGIVFDGPNYTGKCSFLAKNISDLSVDGGGYYPTPIKNGTLSSIIVAKTSFDQDVAVSEYTGYVTLYNKPSCPNETSEEVKKCELRTFGQNPLPSGCDSRNIMSLSITGRYGVVLISNKGECRYYDTYSLDKEVCQSKLPTAIYDPAGTYPVSYILFPLEKR